MRSFLALLAWTLTLSALWADAIVGVPLGYAPGTAPLVKIDPDTGAYSVLATSGNSYNALAQNSQGDLFAAFFSGSAPNGRIARINPQTGAALDVFNAVTPGAGSIRGLAFDADDRLFAVVNRDDASGSPTVNDDFYEINLTTQTTQLIGSLGYLSVQAMDVAPNGHFYAWDNDFGLLAVDPLTGAAADVNPSIGGTPSIQSIVFAPDGRLFGAREQLFSIDPATGTYTAIGGGGEIDLRGIEWIVPEPGTCILTGIGVMLVLCLRKGCSETARAN